MRELRQQLIALFEEARQEQNLEMPPPRLQAALVHDALQMLQERPDKKPGHHITFHARTLTHGPLHRHIILIRCPDQAFYLDAIKGYLLKQDIQPIAQHTIMASMQNENGKQRLQAWTPEMPSANNFMFIALYLSATLVTDRDGTMRDIAAILRAVDLSVSDFEPMQKRINTFAEKLGPEDAANAELLKWMNDGRYLLFGIQHGHKKLGLFRDSRTLERIAPGILEESSHIAPATSPGVEWLHLASCTAHLYSEIDIDVVRICWSDKSGALEEGLLLGHFSRSIRQLNSGYVPRLRDQWQQLEASPLLRRSSFYRREMRTLFDRIPKPLLMSIATQAWLTPLKRVIDMTSPIQMTVEALTPHIGNVEYLFIAMPSRRFGPNVLRHIEQTARDHNLDLHGTETVGVGPYRLIFIAFQAIGVQPDMQQLGEALNECILFWKDRAKQAVLKSAKKLDIPLALRELEQMPQLYQEIVPPEAFVSDLLARDRALKQERTLVEVRSLDEGIEIKTFARELPPLGHLVERIQAFGVTALQEAVVDFGSEAHAIRITIIRASTPEPLHHETVARLARGLEHVLNDEADHDALNQLLLSAGLDIDHIAVLIAQRNHLVQLIPDAAPTPLSIMMTGHPKASASLFRMFEARHRPAMPHSYLEEARHDFDAAMENVFSLSDDRWFRAMAELVEAGLRTNAFLREAGEPLAIKINPRRLEFVPHPRPYREIFVHGVHVEGVHLRAGPVARGGIRYSNRPSDYRTEVLELVTTQIVKNGVIVPTGAKGGFVVRGGDSPDFVLHQYRLFIRALLELTDNLIHNESLAPDGMRVAEEDLDDPYLVVAADKGTARFSDDANEESRLAGFWLDDAFASGGRHGYDHKAVGITARGAWVCAAQQLAQLDRDAWQDPISVVAIGDMGGDVFGNGMLLNPNLRLLGAFNHRHIFLDLDPDAATAFAERTRLFEAVNGWDGYQSSLISAGGGVFERTAKRIPISAEVQQALGIEASSLSGEALIRAMLAAPVDMLYNGGIGTYVKATDESHGEVRDPANNNVRIDATDLRCKVVCEGGNLGFTQKARIEYAQGGGLIHTDAIDNSAGVDMSDHEVNLKILFAATSASAIGNARRNQLMRQLTDDVTEQCLKDNLLQSRALLLAQKDANDFLPKVVRLRETLLKEGRLDRRVDPGMEQDELLLLKPQLAVLLGHEKNRIHEVLDEEGYCDRSVYAKMFLHGYFPKAIQRRFADAIEEHPLRPGIVHTHAANHMVNHIGLASLHHLQSLLETPLSDIIEALLIAETLLDCADLRERVWQQVNNTNVAIEIQTSMQQSLMHFAEELLRLCNAWELDRDSLEQQTRQLRRFRKSNAIEGMGGRDSSCYLEILKSAGQAGIGTDDASHLAALPMLSQMATACYLSRKHQTSLLHCLHAMQAALYLLPFTEIEERLRSPQWGSAVAHPLRRQWLHRLTLMKAGAGEQLLNGSGHSVLERGRTLWHDHSLWPALKELLTTIEDADHDGGADEDQRMRTLLALSHLQGILDGTV